MAGRKKRAIPISTAINENEVSVSSLIWLGALFEGHCTVHITLQAAVWSISGGPESGKPLSCHLYENSVCVTLGILPGMKGLGIQRIK